MTKSINPITRINYTVHIWKEGAQYVAHAMPLDVMSSGGTPDEARQALDEAVTLFLETAAEAGTLSVILEEVGYELKDHILMPPEWVAIERHSVVLGN